MNYDSEEGVTTITYLAGPYTKGSPEKRVARFHALTFVAAELIRAKRIIYSPITMTHPIDLVMAGNNSTLGSEFWVSFDEAFMEHCSEIVVLTLPGWKDSSGVSREIAYFEHRGISPLYESPDKFGISAENSLYAAAFHE
jgi:Domain of unknown function (DUF1937)